MFSKYPFVQQQGITDCGAASLLMILKYYKGSVSLNQMCEITSTNKSGTTAYNLKKAAEELGFKAKGFKVTFEHLKKIKQPFIAHVVVNQSYQHYVVIYKIDYQKEKITIADPADKIKKMKFVEFKRIWTGVVIELAPVKQVAKYINQKPFSIFKLLNIIKKDAKLMIPLAVFVTFFSIINTYYFKFVIDGLIDDNQIRYFFLIFVCFLFINILKIITDYYKNKILILIKKKIDANLSQITFKNIISLPYKYYCSRTTGEIVSRINDLHIVKNMLTTILFTLFIDIPITLTVMIFLFLLSKELFLVSLVMYGLFVLIMFLFRKKYQIYINQIQKQRADLNSKLVQYISSYETIKGLGAENKTNQILQKDNFNLLNTTKQFDQLQNIQNLLKEIISTIGFLVVIYYGAILVIEQKITIGTLLTFNTLLLYFLDPVKNLIELDINYNETKNAFKRIVTLFYPIKKEGFVNKKLKGGIQFKNLSFSYDSYQNILEKINLKIEAGEKVLLYGKSGSGKSTLLKLLMKFFSIKRNHLFLDEFDINDLTKKTINQNITYLSQTENLFNDTVYKNLIFANNKKTKVNKMLNICKINEFIDHQLGLEMMIEENANNISGGQKQRMVLARCLMKSAQIVLIDEGFSEMDVELEKEILQEIFKLYPSKTFLIISHRLANVDLYHKIVQFQKGRIIDVRSN